MNDASYHPSSIQDYVQHILTRPVGNMSSVNAQSLNRQPQQHALHELSARGVDFYVPSTSQPMPNFAPARTTSVSSSTHPSSSEYSYAPQALPYASNFGRVSNQDVRHLTARQNPYPSVDPSSSSSAMHPTHSVPLHPSSDLSHYASSSSSGPRQGDGPWRPASQIPYPTIDSTRHETSLKPPDAMSALVPAQKLFLHAWKETEDQIDRELSQIHASYERVLEEERAKFASQLQSARERYGQQHNDVEKERSRLATLCEQSRMESEKLKFVVAKLVEERKSYLEENHRLQGLLNGRARDDMANMVSTVVLLREKQAKSNQEMQEMRLENDKLMKENARVSTIVQERDAEVSRLKEEWAIARTLRLKLHRENQRQKEELKETRDTLLSEKNAMMKEVQIEFEQRVSELLAQRQKQCQASNQLEPTIETCAPEDSDSDIEILPGPPSTKPPNS